MSDPLQSCRLAVMSAATLLVAACPVAGATPETDLLGKDWSRYQVIVDSEPFGKAPPRGDSGADGDAGAAAAAAEPAGPGLAETTRLSVVSMFGGTPAAGFTDTTTGKTYYLLQGESLGEFTVLAVDALAGSARIRKGQQEETLTLTSVTGTAASGSPPAVSAAVTATAVGTGEPGEELSYAERQRRRVEEARARMEEARRRAEEARQSQEDVARLTGEALQRHLRDLNLQMIRSGQGTPLPIELTPQEVAQLAADGFDVTLPPGTPTEPSETAPPRLRRGETALPEAE
jgi:hypothetical protein